MNCKNCSKEYTPLRQSNHTYCSNLCQQSYQSLKRFEAGIASNKCARGVLEKLRGWQCELCGIEEWENQRAPLIVDHINGDASNSLPENLRLICPNCDALLPTYKARNKGNGRTARMKRYYEAKSY